ncbi:MAG: AarF/ABC1/UbiB kinase family protein [Chitinophagales bacterium]
MLFDQTIKNINRTREIIAILFKYGFEDVVTNTPLQNFVPQKKRLTWLREEKPVFEYSRWERVRMAVEELGATFIKGAQVLSNRPDILPKELIAELEKLQDSVPPFKYELARQIIEEDTGKPLEAIFSYFNEKTIGSASIGQVYAAKLKSGERVVVKVQRPEVAQLIETDISIVKEIVRRGQGYFESLGILNPMDVVEAFERNMQKELDYKNEARNILQFREFYKGRNDFYVPNAYKSISTGRVLVLEFIKGCKITDIEQIKKWGLIPTRIAEQGMNIYLSQIFEFGYFHADPHPGNVLVREDGMICLIDFGMVGKLTRRDKYAFAGIFIGMTQQNAQAMALNLRKLAIDDQINDMRALEQDLNLLVEDFSALDIGESSIADLTSRIQKLIYTYKLRVPGSIFIILRAMAILEGIGKTIHPDMNVFQYVKPYGAKLIQEQYSPKNLASDAYTVFTSFMSLAYSFPMEAREILKQMRQGKYQSRVEIEGFTTLMQSFERLGNRFILTLLIVGILIASAIGMTAGAAAGPVSSYGIPYISLIGLIFSGVMLLALFWRMLRE